MRRKCTPYIYTGTAIFIYIIISQLPDFQLQNIPRVLDLHSLCHLTSYRAFPEGPGSTLPGHVCFRCAAAPRFCTMDWTSAVPEISKVQDETWGTMGCPCYKLVYNPMKTIDISPNITYINHSEIGVINQLSYLGGKCWGRRNSDKNWNWLLCIETCSECQSLRHAVTSH